MSQAADKKSFQTSDMAAESRLKSSSAGSEEIPSPPPLGITLRDGVQWNRAIPDSSGLVKMSDLARKDRRLETFKEIQRSAGSHPKKKDLAEAGFYAAPKKTKPAAACCFCCGVGPTDWPDKCDPWVEHARLSPGCPFLRLKKGKAFVAVVQDLDKKHGKISLDMVKYEMERLGNETFQRAQNWSPDPKTVCSFCHSREVGVCFLPCGHMIACPDCAFDREICRVCKRTIEYVSPVSLPSQEELQVLAANNP